MALSDDELANAYRRFAHLVVRRCRAILGDDAEAMDAMQEVFLRLMRYGDRFRGVESPVRWLYRVADRICFDHLRARKRRPAPDDTATASLASPTNLASVVRERDLVMALLSHFDDRAKSLAVMHFVEGLTQEDIARQLGCSRKTVNQELGRIRRRATRLGEKLGFA